MLLDAFRGQIFARLLPQTHAWASLEAVREAKGQGAAQLLDYLKKGEMAAEAERLLKGSGWLPEVLRRADLVTFDGEAVGEGQGEDAGEPEDVDLPAFLTADLPENAASMMAAE